MKYYDFICLEWKSFKRSTNLHQKIAGQFLRVFLFLILLVYVIVLPFLAYYGIQSDNSAADPFLAFHNYLFIFFFFVIYVRLTIPFTHFDPSPFLLLPIQKNKMIGYHLWRHFINVGNILLILSVLIYAGILWYNHYDFIGIFSWSSSMILFVYIISFLLFFLEKNQFTNVILGVAFFFIIIKMQYLTMLFKPYGKSLYSLYKEPLWIIVPLLILLSILILLFHFLKTRFYIDRGATKNKKTILTNTGRLFDSLFKGNLRAVIKKDVKMIVRSARPRQTLFGFILMYVFAILIYGGYLPEKSFPTLTYSIFLALFLTGFFVMGFGAHIPAWDSENFSFLMSQNISYRDYLNAKWNLMIISILIAVILCLPFLFFGKQIYLMILAMAVFNAGINIPLVLLTGLLNTTPIKLNEKVRAFQNNETFNLKLMLLGLLRIAIPVAIYYYVKQYTGEIYAVSVFILLGIIGLLFKKFILKKIAIRYQKNKYKTLYNFQKNES